MTIDHLSITADEVRLILEALKPFEDETSKAVEHMDALLDTWHGEELSRGLSLLTDRDKTARKVNDIQRLGYYLRAKVDK